MDLYELLMADEPDAAARAQALGKAMGLREQAGLLGQLSGDKVLSGVGGSLMGQADSGRQRLGDVLRQRQARQQAQAQLAAQQQQNATENALKERGLGLQGQEIALRKAALDQDAWSYGQDATGGGFMFNKKTGQTVQLAPNGAFPGHGSGLKPNQFEADVQAFGKDVEPLAKAAPDIAALKAATAADDVAGFGPVEGRLPNLVTPKEGIANRQAAGRLMAAIIQATSGQAASEKEVERLLEANGMGRAATTTQLRQGVAKLEAQYNNLLKQREAKYHPQVVQTYNERGGYTSKSAQQPTADAPPAAATPAPNVDDLRKKYGL